VRKPDASFTDALHIASIDGKKEKSPPSVYDRVSGTYQNQS